ncbi:hypothetical protein PMIN06_004655 [Paraphaeosphaeria minitans]
MAALTPEFTLYDLASTQGTSRPPSPRSPSPHTTPQHPTTFIMDSPAIAAFIETTHPAPEAVLTSDLGAQIEEKARKAVGPAFYVSLVPREWRILSPRSREYFQRMREAALGHPLEHLLAREDVAWDAFGDGARAAGALMRTHKEKGPFVLGEKPSFTDFVVAGALQNARVVEVGVWER